MQPLPETATHNPGGLTHWYSSIQFGSMIADIINSPMLFKFQPALKTENIVKARPNSRLSSHEREILVC